MADETPSKNVNPSGNPEPLKAQPDSGAENPAISPEAEAVLLNRPSASDGKKSGASAEANPNATPSFIQANPSSSKPTQAPTKIGKETRKNNAKFLTIMGLSLAGLFVLFIILMVFVIAGGGEKSPVLTAFGLGSGSIKSFLLTVVNLSFGLLSLLFFVLAVIGVFRLLFAKKGDADARMKGVRMTLVGFLPLALSMVVWLFLFNFVNRIQISAERIIAEIKVVDPPILTGLTAPLEVTFSSENVIKSLQNNRLQITGVKWDFDGDGIFNTIPTDNEVSYLYSLRGSYNVGLQVTVASEEQPREYFFPLVIEDALFSAIPSSGTAPLEVKFDASSLIPEGTRVQTLDWDFDGDGVYDTTGKDAIRPSYRYEKIGQFKAHLRFVDQSNLVQNFYRDIEITASDKPLLIADIQATPALSGAIPLQVRFDGGGSTSVKGSIVSYDWDFGDGSALQKGKTVSHVYNNPGVYQVKLTVKEDSGNEANTSAQVEARGISSIPVAKIITQPAINQESQVKGELPFKVMFDASASTDADNDIVDYAWDFGAGGSLATGQKAEFTYETEGIYSATLTVSDSEGQKHNVSVSIVVEKPGVKSVITTDVSEGTAPLTVSFDGSSSSAFNGSIVSYEWDFNDGSPKSITGARITHKFEAVGSYTVTLKVVTDQNESADSQKTIFIREIPLRACFEPSRKDGDAPLSVTFDSKCSTGSVSTYRWNFGDGTEADSRKPSHTFENPGTYNVSLEVSDDKSNVHVFSDVIVAKGELK